METPKDFEAVKTDEQIEEKWRHIARQLDIIHPDLLETKITIFGAGAIGSFVTFGLAKTGFTDLTVFDDDKVSMENMSCSLYRRCDVEKDKVAALRDIIIENTGTEIKPMPRRFAALDEQGRPEFFESPPLGVSIVCVDSMKARQTIWDVFKEQRPPGVWFIDSRMSAEEGLIYSLRPEIDADRDMYDATLYSDDEAVQERCTERSTLYTAFLLSGQIIKVLKTILTDKPAEYERICQWSIKHSDLVAHKVAKNALSN